MDVKDVILGLSVLGNIGQIVYSVRKARSEGKNIDADTYAKLLSSINHAVVAADEAKARANAEGEKRRELHEQQEKNTDEIRDLKWLFQNAERDYRSQMDEFKIACWEVDGDGNNHGANYTFLDITGLEIDEYRSTHWLETVCEHDRPRVKRIWQTMIQDGGTHVKLKFSFCNRKTPGVTTEVEAYVKSHPLPSGRVFKYTARTKPLLGSEG